MVKYLDNHFKREVVTIYPGEYYVSKGPEFVSTILGSCVAIVLFDEENKIGGINHFMLAKDKFADSEADLNGALKTKYGKYAIDELIKEMESQGAKKFNFQAKIFGGSNVFNIPDSNLDMVGNENIRFAKEYLAKLNIPIIAEDLGGVPSRKVVFDPATFKVLVKKINRQNDDSEC